MNDGAFHARHRPAVAASASRWDDAAVGAATAAATRDLAARMDGNGFLAALPVQAMARLLGVPVAQLDAAVGAVQDFVRGIATGATPAEVDRADAAARLLLAQGEAQGLEPVAAANRIALMQQSLDATAGLIGNAILGRTGVRETLAADPPIHNTRRFAAADLELGGQRIASGAALVVLLVGDGLGFGDGAHACPGERIALGIAQAAVTTLGSLGALAPFARHTGYRPLPNARIPAFAP
jgi:cytochrome P450